MTRLNLKMTGDLAVANAFRQLSTLAKSQRERWVGSSAHYGPYQEFGTVVLRARPHWRPAIRKLMDEEDFLPESVFKALEGGLTTFLALRLERLVKKEIRAKQIIDTGNYRASVQTGKSESEVVNKSDAAQTVRST